jgi:hypothetical protein
MLSRYHSGKSIIFLADAWHKLLTVAFRPPTSVNSLEVAAEQPLMEETVQEWSPWKIIHLPLTTN